MVTERSQREDQTERTLGERVERWLDHVFYAGAEVSLLAIPALVLLITVPDQWAVSLAGLATLGAATCAVAAFRGGYVDVGPWPRPGHLGTLPLRSAYYAGVVGGVTRLGARTLAWTGRGLDGVVVAVLVSTVVTAAVLAQFPRTVVLLRWGAARWEALATE